MFTEVTAKVIAEITMEIATEVTIKVLIELASGTKLNLNYSSGDL